MLFFLAPSAHTQHNFIVVLFVELYKTKCIYSKKDTQRRSFYSPRWNFQYTSLHHNKSNFQQSLWKTVVALFTFCHSQFFFFSSNYINNELFAFQHITHRDKVFQTASAIMVEVFFPFLKICLETYLYHCYFTASYPKYILLFSILKVLR